MYLAGQLCGGRKGLFLPFHLTSSTLQEKTKNRVMLGGFKQMGADLGCSDQKKIPTDYGGWYLPLLGLVPIYYPLSSFITSSPELSLN